MRVCVRALAVAAAVFTHIAYIVRRIAPCDATSNHSHHVCVCVCHTQHAINFDLNTYEKKKMNLLD